jgi:hypothetical protein
MAHEQSGADALRAALADAQTEVARAKAREAQGRDFAARRAQQKAELMRKNTQGTRAFLQAIARAGNPGLQRLQWVEPKLLERGPLVWRVGTGDFQYGLDRRGIYYRVYGGLKGPVERGRREPEGDMTPDLARVLAHNGVELD